MKCRILFIILPMLFVFSCQKEDNQPVDNQNNSQDTTSIPQYTYDTTSCNVLSSPDTISINDTISIEVVFSIYNTCGSLSKFLVSGTKTDQYLAIETKYDNTTYCQYVLTTVDATYKYKPDTPGSHLFTFKGVSSDTTVTVFVE